MEKGRTFGIALIATDLSGTEGLLSALNFLGHRVHYVRHGPGIFQSLRGKSIDLIIVDWRVPVSVMSDWLHWLGLSDDGTSGVNLLFWGKERLDTSVRVDVASLPIDISLLGDLNKVVLDVNGLLGGGEGGGGGAGDTFTFGPYEIDRRRQRISLFGEPIDLTSMEYSLAELFFRNPGHLLERKTLFEFLWGNSHDQSSRALDTHLCNLRSKLSFGQGNGPRLTTIYRRGYRLDYDDGGRIIRKGASGSKGA